MTDARFAPEIDWCWDLAQGMTIAEISEREGISKRRIREGAAWARRTFGIPGPGDTVSIGAAVKRINLRPPRLIPLFGIGSFTPLTACSRHSWIVAGSLFCCMVCHLSGVEEHPALQRSRLTDPPPEPPPPEPPKDIQKTEKKETRREKRLRIYGPPYTPPPEAEHAA